MISVEPIDYFSFECDLFPSRENIIRSRTVLGTPRLRANAGRFNISLGELAHPDRGWNVWSAWRACASRSLAALSLCLWTTRCTHVAPPRSSFGSFPGLCPLSRGDSSTYDTSCENRLSRRWEHAYARRQQHVPHARHPRPHLSPTPARPAPRLCAAGLATTLGRSQNNLQTKSSFCYTMSNLPPQPTFATETYTDSYALRPRILYRTRLNALRGVRAFRLRCKVPSYRLLPSLVEVNTCSKKTR